MQYCLYIGGETMTERERAAAALKRQERQYKRQNAYIKENYFRTTVTIRRELADIVKRAEPSINGYINRLITEDLRQRGLIPDTPASE